MIKLKDILIEQMMRHPGNNNQYNKALKDFDEALNLDPEFTLGYYCRGETRLLKGDRKGACEDWKEFRIRYLKKENPYLFLNYYCRPD